jgi:hypothetical protein
VVTFRHNGEWIVATPVRSGWTVRFREQETTSRYLEAAVARVLELDRQESATVVATLIEAALDETHDESESRDDESGSGG